MAFEMENELGPEPAIDTPNAILRRFVECVDVGEVRRQLPDDCILNIFYRCAKGVPAVPNYLLTQITGRYKHVNFVDAEVCDEMEEIQLKSRFNRSFEVLRRRLRTKQNFVSMGNRRAESDDDADSDAEKNPTQLASTPPRIDTPTTTLKYIEAFGELEAVNDHVERDGGIALNEKCKVKLTLGYRLCKINEMEISEICLMVYEKYSPAVNKLPSRNPRCMPPGPNAHTDDEGEEPPTQSVRRALFATADGDANPYVDTAVKTDAGFMVEPDLFPSPTLKVIFTPRKRQHKKDPYLSSKRSMRF